MHGEARPRSSLATLGSIGLGCLGVGLTAWFSNLPQSLSTYQSKIHITGIALSVVGVLLVFVAITLWIVRLTKKATDKALTKAFTHFVPDFDERYAEDEDIETICTLGRQAIGSNHPDETSLSQRLAKNRNIIKCLIRKKVDGGSIVGYYTIYPITAGTRTKILSGQITSGKQFGLTQISTSFSSCTAIYISMIYGSSLLSKACVLWTLKNDLNTTRRTNKNLDLLFARPATSAGLRLLRKYGFEPINDERGIWSRSFSGKMLLLTTPY